MLSKLSRFVKPTLGRQFAALSTAPQPQPNPNPDVKYTGVSLSLDMSTLKVGYFSKFIFSI